MHMMVKDLGVTLRHPRWRKMQPPHTYKWKHFKRMCECHNMCRSSDHLKADVTVEYEWTFVWIVNRVAMMSIKTSAKFAFMDFSYVKDQ